MDDNSEHRYDSIINLPHHQSANHPRMSALSRAAQFSPFAALVGYDEAVEETARLTDSKISLSEDEQAELDRKLALLREKMSERPEITVTYFVPDERKDGGEYVMVCKELRKIDDFERKMIFTDRSEINIDDIISIEGEVFSTAE